MSTFPRIELLKAIDRADVAAIREIVESGYSPDNRLLADACKVGNIEVVRVLLEASNYRNYSTQYAPEAFAAMRCRHLEVFRLLCESGLDPDATEYSKHGWSITELAISEKRVEYLRLLLPLSPMLTLDYDDEETTEEEFESGNIPSTLELAARAGDVELAEILVEAGFPLGQKSAHYYLEKAQQNSPKYQQRQTQAAKKDKGRRQQEKEVETKKTEYANFWLYIVLVLCTAALCWFVLRVVLWRS